VNYRDVPYLTPERARKLVDDLKAGRELDQILDDLKKAKSLTDARGTASESPNGQATEPTDDGQADA
jgi:hypothetical protein